MAGKPSSRVTSRANSIQQTDSPIALTPTGTGLPPLPPLPMNARSSTLMSSTSSAQGSASNAFDLTPAVSEGGFRSAITETCNVVSRQGNIVRAMVTGEISATFKDVQPVDLEKNGKIIKLRIERFEQLEKVAPNPQFVKPLSADQPGEYAVDAEALLGAATADPNRPVILFKYQLHIQEGKAGRLVPVTVTPQWKCEETDTKLLIVYGSNPDSHILSSTDSAFASPFDESASSVTIDDLSFSVPISSPTVTNPQSKPYPGEYDPTTKRIVYRTDPLSNDTPSGKVAARLGVDEKSVPQPITVRWLARGVLCSNLSVSVLGGEAGGVDEFGAETVGGSSWKLENVVKNCQSGKFVVD